MAGENDRTVEEINSVEENVLFDNEDDVSQCSKILPAAQDMEMCENETCSCQCESSSKLSSITPSSTKSTKSFHSSKTPLAYTKGKKPKLRTSKDIYDRLKWDEEPILISTNKHETEPQKLDKASVYIGYKDRFLGICELPFEEFIPGGEIPFHRLYYFRTGGPPVLPFIGKDGEIKVREDNLPEGAVFIWDRESRTDLIFFSGNSTIYDK